LPWQLSDDLGKANERIRALEQQCAEKDKKVCSL
jgi:hypothetical protein